MVVTGFFAQCSVQKNCNEFYMLHFLYVFITHLYIPVLLFVYDVLFIIKKSLVRILL